MLVARLIGTAPDRRLRVAAAPGGEAKERSQSAAAGGPSAPRTAGGKPLTARAVEQALEEAGIDYARDVSACLKCGVETSFKLTH